MQVQTKKYRPCKTRSGRATCKKCSSKITGVQSRLWLET